VKVQRKKKKKWKMDFVHFSKRPPTAWLTKTWELSVGEKKGTFAEGMFFPLFSPSASFPSKVQIPVCILSKG